MADLKNFYEVGEGKCNGELECLSWPMNHFCVKMPHHLSFQKCPRFNQFKK